VGLAPLHQQELRMKKYECSYSVSPSVTYYVIVIANNDTHAAEMASGCVKRSSTFSQNVEPRRWNVSVIDTGYSGDAKVVDYYKR
jgi:hypothetical protein